MKKISPKSVVDNFMLIDTYSVIKEPCYTGQLCLKPHLTILFMKLLYIYFFFRKNVKKMQEKFRKFSDLNPGPLDLELSGFPLDNDTPDYLKIYTCFDMLPKKVVLYLL